MKLQKTRHVRPFVQEGVQIAFKEATIAQKTTNLGPPHHHESEAGSTLATIELTITLASHHY